METAKWSSSCESSSSAGSFSVLIRNGLFSVERRLTWPLRSNFISARARKKSNWCHTLPSLRLEWELVRVSLPFCMRSISWSLSINCWRSSSTRRPLSSTVPIMELILFSFSRRAISWKNKQNRPSPIVFRRKTFLYCRNVAVAFTRREYCLIINLTRFVFSFR